MSNPEIDHDAETFEKLKSAGIPKWVLPLDEIDAPAKKFFERMRAEYRDLAPPLLALFESDPDAMSGDDIDWLNYGLFFAAEFKDGRFSDAFLRLLRCDEDTLDAIFGDFLTEVMDVCVARICGRNLEGIKALVLDASADRYARWTVLDSLKILCWEKEYSKESLQVVLRDVIENLEDTQLWDGITSVVATLGWGGFEADVLAALEAGHLEEPLFGDADELREVIRKNSTRSAVEGSGEFDAVAFLVNYWEWSQRIGNEIDEAEEMWMSDGDEWDGGGIAEGYVGGEGGGLERDAEKVGRNDPCPCGSGKKFKKCCG